MGTLSQVYKGQEILLQRNVDAISIPLGKTATLVKGSAVVVMQAKGSSVSVSYEGCLYLIEGHDLDSLGLKALESPTLDQRASEEEMKAFVWAQLRTCFDPEIPVNIVDLGLVYGCRIERLLTGDERIVTIRMTLTALGCGMGDVIAEDARRKILSASQFSRVDVEIVFDPPWSREMMSEEARLELGMFQGLYRRSLTDVSGLRSRFLAEKRARYADRHFNLLPDFRQKPSLAVFCPPIMPPRMFWLLKGLLKVLLASLLLLVISIVVINLWILQKTHPRIEHEVSLCAAKPVGLVFGTAQWLRQGGSNPYYLARMETSAELLHLRRVQHLLLSGDNHTRYYNEPHNMWRSLRHRNVDDVRMTLDYAGFSTFDSVIRAKEVFGVDRLMLISQDWHLPRALFIADAMGIESTGCAVPKDGIKKGEWRLRLREWLARAATFGDLYFWGREPYFLGPVEPIRLSHERAR